MLEGQEQLAVETSEKSLRAIKMRMHVHKYSKTFNEGFDMQIKCWRVLSAGCSVVIVPSAQR